MPSTFEEVGGVSALSDVYSRLFSGLGRAEQKRQRVLATTGLISNLATSAAMAAMGNPMALKEGMEGIGNFIKQNRAIDGMKFKEGGLTDFFKGLSDDRRFRDAMDSWLGSGMVAGATSGVNLLGSFIADQVYKKEKARAQNEAAGVYGNLFMRSFQGGGNVDNNIAQAIIGSMGGPNVPIEAEGGEAVATPEGEDMMIKGPSHDAGGVDVEVPEDSVVFTKRVKINGKTIAERKKKRDRKLKSIIKKAGKNPYDEVWKQTMEMMMRKTAKEDSEDIEIQEGLKDIVNREDVKQVKIDKEENKGKKSKDVIPEFNPGEEQEEEQMQTSGQVPSSSPMDAIMGMLGAGGGMPMQKGGGRVKYQNGGKVGDPTKKLKSKMEEKGDTLYPIDSIIPSATPLEKGLIFNSIRDLTNIRSNIHPLYKEYIFPTDEQFRLHMEDISRYNQKASKPTDKNNIGRRDIKKEEEMARLESEYGPIISKFLILTKRLTPFKQLSYPYTEEITSSDQKMLEFVDKYNKRAKEIEEERRRRRIMEERRRRIIEEMIRRKRIRDKAKKAAKEDRENYLQFLKDLQKSPERYLNNDEYLKDIYKEISDSMFKVNLENMPVGYMSPYTSKREMLINAAENIKKSDVPDNFKDLLNEVTRQIILRGENAPISNIDINIPEHKVNFIKKSIARLAAPKYKKPPVTNIPYYQDLVKDILRSGLAPASTLPSSELPPHEGGVKKVPSYQDFIRGLVESGLVPMSRLPNTELPTPPISAEEIPSYIESWYNSQRDNLAPMSNTPGIKERESGEDKEADKKENKGRGKEGKKPPLTVQQMAHIISQFGGTDPTTRKYLYDSIVKYLTTPGGAEFPTDTTPLGETELDLTKTPEEKTSVKEAIEGTTEEATAESKKKGEGAGEESEARKQLDIMDSIMEGLGLSRGDRMLLGAMKAMQYGYPTLAALAWKNHPEIFNFYRDFGRQQIQEYRKNIGAVKRMLQTELANIKARRNAAAKKVLSTVRNKSQARALLKSIDAQAQAAINEAMSRKAGIMSQMAGDLAYKAMYAEDKRRQGALGAHLKRVDIYEQGMRGLSKALQVAAGMQAGAGEKLNQRLADMIAAYMMALNTRNTEEAERIMEKIQSFKERQRYKKRNR